MNVSVFGTGYVGVVTAACLARKGHRVVGVDVAPHKVGLLQAGRSPVVEEGLADLVAEAVSSGALRATLDARDAVASTEITLVSVGTPSQPGGALDLRSLTTVMRELGEAMREKPDPHTVVVRSTVLPGTTRRELVPMLEAASGRRSGDGLAVCYNPEFLREGSSIADFYGPPYTIVGEATPGAGDRVVALYSGIQAPLHRCSIEVAEALKYVSNAFHALKVAFANEIGVVLKSMGVDGREVLEMACRDTKLNVSAAYLRPGYAFGGSCLPKDLRAVLHAARARDVDAPLLSSVLPANQLHIDRAARLVLETGERDVALLGLSFKPGTDDLRESPLVQLAERLLGKGCRLRIYDPDVSLGRLTGANKAYIEREIPHIGELLAPSLEEALASARVAVVGSLRQCDPDVLVRWARENVVVDLDGVPPNVAAAARVYWALSW